MMVAIASGSASGSSNHVARRVGIAPERVEDERGYEKDHGIEHRGRALVWMGDVLGKQGGREWDERDTEQQRQIDRQQPMIDRGKELEDVVVIDPHDADDEKADQVPEVAGPEIEQGAPEAVLPFDLLDRRGREFRESGA